MVESVDKISHQIHSGENWLYRPQFPDHWERRPLYSLAQWVNGLAFRNIQFSTAGMPVIKIAEIKGGISDQTKFTKQSFDESVRIRPGDLLFSWSGQPETSIDVFWWHGPVGWLNQHIFRVTTDPRVDETFFYYLLIPFHIAEAVKCAGRLRVECSIQSQAVSDRTRSGSDSSSPRYASTASIFSSMLPYVLPSTTTCGPLGRPAQRDSTQDCMAAG